jgi:hypothetical protein
MELTLATWRRRLEMDFGQRLKILSVEWQNTAKTTELERLFAEHGITISHQAIGSYFSGRSLPEEKRLVEMMDAMDLDDEQRRELVASYADRRPGLREICSYLVG